MAISFDGGAKEIETSTGLYTDVTDVATWAFWAKPTSSGAIKILGYQRDSFRNYQFYDDRFVFYILDGVISSARVEVFGGFALNTWRHYVVRYDGNEAATDDRCEIWINGVGPVVDTHPTALPTAMAQDSTYSLSLGQIDTYSAYRWPGELAEWTMWKIALSFGECQSLYYSSHIRMRPDKLAAYFPLLGTDVTLDDYKDHIRGNNMSKEGALGPDGVDHPSLHESFLGA